MVMDSESDGASDTNVSAGRSSKVGLLAVSMERPHHNCHEVVSKRVVANCSDWNMNEYVTSGRLSLQRTHTYRYHKFITLHPRAHYQ